MAPLTAPQRRTIQARLMQQLSEVTDATNLTKGDLLAAVDGVDNWIDAQQASFNAAIPQPARAELTAKQKALLFMLVMNLRWEVF